MHPPGIVYYDDHTIIDLDVCNNTYSTNERAPLGNRRYWRRILFFNCNSRVVQYDERQGRKNAKRKEKKNQKKKTKK